MSASSHRPWQSKTRPAASPKNICHVCKKPRHWKKDCLKQKYQRQSSNTKPSTSLMHRGCSQKTQEVFLILPLNHLGETSVMIGSEVLTTLIDTGLTFLRSSSNNALLGILKKFHWWEFLINP